MLAQLLLDLPLGTIRATVLIETLPAAFEMEEILDELRDHSAGLDTGRWDYIFSYIRTFAHRGVDFVLPDRARITMTTPFKRAYTELLVATCHGRGAHAIGGMAAFEPNRSDDNATKLAPARVRADKQREAGDGFDRCGVAHPALMPTARDAFTHVLGDRPHQIVRQRPDVRVRSRPAHHTAGAPGRHHAGPQDRHLGRAALPGSVGRRIRRRRHRQPDGRAATVEIFRAQVR